MLQRITPFLWFDRQAEEAASFYVSIFPDSRIVKRARYSEVGPGPAGSVMTVQFQLAGQTFVGLNGGPHFKFTEAVSFVVNCQTQEEVDHYWEKLSAGGAEVQCGWLKDKFGLSWQIVATALPELLTDPDRQKANRVMQAMLQMTKIDIAASGVPTMHREVHPDGRLGRHEMASISSRSTKRVFSNDSQSFMQE